MCHDNNECMACIKEEMKQKRTKGSAKDTKRLKKSELIVQRLSSEVSGKAQKFCRIGPRKFLPFDPDSRRRHDPREHQASMRKIF